jgi:short-subunit dehydrogenase
LKRGAFPDEGLLWECILQLFENVEGMKFKTIHFVLRFLKSQKATPSGIGLGAFSPTCLLARRSKMNKGLRNEIFTLLGFGAIACLALRKPRAAAGLGLAAGGLALLSQNNPVSFRHRNVIITGGSRGLGLALARELVGEGARVVLLARDGQELEKARQILLFEKPGAEILTLPCDVTKKEELTKCFGEAIAQWGSIDMLINNAGAILVGPFDSLKREDFEAQMELHLYAVMHAVQLVLPHFRENKRGRIVNICSMGGKVAVPHMLTYDTSKFALAGFSQGIAAELSRENIQVTTVYPTLMNTGSPIQAVFKGDYEKEYVWFAAGDNFPGIAMPPAKAARKILQAVRDGKTELTPSSLGQVRIGVGAFFPELMGWTMDMMNRLMPRGASREYHTGADSRGSFNKKLWTYPLRRRAEKAEQSFNQEAKTDAKFNVGLLH